MAADGDETKARPPADSWARHRAGNRFIPTRKLNRLVSYASQTAAVIALSILVAGCADTPALTTPGQGKGPISESELLDEETGAIQGHVSTEELLPIAGALVALRGTEFTDVTDENGFFLLRSVPPGSHTLDVVALGYASTARLAKVDVGQVLNVELTLAAIAVAELGYVSVLQHSGFLECAMGAVVFVAPCTYGYRSAWGNAHNAGVNISSATGLPSDLHNNKFWLNFTIQPGADQLIAELVWDAGSAAATTMQLFILCGDFDYVLNECTERHRYGVNTSNSPVRVDVNRLDKDDDGDDNMTKGCPDSKFCVTGTEPVWWTNDVAMPFSTPQFAFQQRFDVFDSIFYYGQAPEGYTIIPDA